MHSYAFIYFTTLWMYKIMSSFSKNSALFLLVYVALKAQLKTHRYFIDYK